MLYEKNKSKELDIELFKNPTSEYRATPFWAWNDNLDKKELLWQIDRFKEMGFGGFHMHVRSGMATPYLSEEFMDLIKSCTDKAKKEKMLSWLYDEDRWPSGAAGGIVTKNLNYRQKLILFTTAEYDEITDGVEFIAEERKGNRNTASAGKVAGFRGVKHMASYDIVLNTDGTLKSYNMIDRFATTVEGTKWNVYMIIVGDSGWFNDQAYLDTLMDEAVEEFIKVTHEKYNEVVGDEFGKTVPAIFTDEPQFTRMATLPFAESKTEITLPWTFDFADTFAKKYGYDITPYLPELLWDLPSSAPSKTRYYYHDHVCDRFTNAFADKCGKWCNEHGFYLTGHMMDEPTLHSQSSALGEAMRAYRNFGIPGIDMLCNRVELSTAKQTQSAVHQYGKEGMLSELYGVTGWDFDFRGHKFQGDWQAALGVTVRVPHLSWYSMKGSAKRDYPGAISYQSAWYKDYPYIEDHFARVNTALTRGKPSVNVGVIHPVESYWLAYGPSQNTASMRTQLENNFTNIINWLLKGCIDFDFISESLLPDQHGENKNNKLNVGEMNYSAIVVPPVITIRGTTVDILTDFAKNGGKVIFLGACPKCVDAEESDKCKQLYELSQKVEFTSCDVLDALESEREVNIVHDYGERTDNFIYNKRIDGKTEWLFIANTTDYLGSKFMLTNLAHHPKNVFITVKGLKKVTVYDTLTGKTYPAPYRHVNGNTEIKNRFHLFDSLLLRLDEADENDVVSQYVSAKPVQKPIKTIDIKDKVEYLLAEDNVLVLDMPYWSENGEVYNEREEMLRIDKSLRDKYGYPLADGLEAQPWVINEEKPEKSVYLKFIINSEIKTKCTLAFEEADEVFFNGEKVDVKKNGYFTDRRIYTMKMPAIKKGENELIIKAPFGKRISLENFFLLGDFGVKVEGCCASIIKKADKLAFGSIVNQGLPFYGAGVTYKIPFSVDEDCDIEVLEQKYFGALIKAKLDGKDIGNIVFNPYALKVENVAKGEHVLELEIVLTRVNSFVAHHTCTEISWKGPGHWYSKGADWSYEYNLYDNGILKSPEIKIYKKQ